MADILIRGMEMPTEQRIEVLIFKNGFVAYYDVEGRYIGQAKAVPLPEGHGELIDKAEAYDRIAEQEGGNYIDMDSVGKGLEECHIIVPTKGGTDNEHV